MDTLRRGAAALLLPLLFPGPLSAAEPADAEVPAAEAPAAEAPAVAPSAAPPNPDASADAPAPSTHWGDNTQVVVGTLSPKDVVIQLRLRTLTPLPLRGHLVLPEGAFTLMEALFHGGELRVDAGVTEKIALAFQLTSSVNVPLSGAMAGVRLGLPPREAVGLSPALTLMAGIQPRLPWGAVYAGATGPSTYSEALSPRVMALHADGNLPFALGSRALFYGHGRIEGHGDVQQLQRHVEDTVTTQRSLRPLSVSAQLGPGLALGFSRHTALRLELGYRFDAGRAGFEGTFATHGVFFEFGLGGATSGK